MKRDEQAVSGWRTAVPSLVTAVRLVVLPGVIVASLEGLRLTALGLYAVILLSDLADGWAARRLGVRTRFGAYFDVLADMAVILALFGLFAARGEIPIWLLSAPAVVAGAFLLGSRGGVPRYDPIGKHYGTILYVFLGVLLWGTTELGSHLIALAVVVLSVVVLAGRWLGGRSRG